jgi:DNA primase
MSQANSAWVDYKEIKAKVSLLQVLGRYGVIETLARHGNSDRFSGPCPIHGGSNKTHFRVSISKNCWNCFGSCHGGGNIIDFVSKKEGVSFRDAALLIKQWFLDEPSEHQKLAALAKEPHAKRDEAKRPHPQITKAHTQQSETEAENEGAPNKPLSFELTKLDDTHPYLEERGLMPETIATFGLGYCSKGLLRGCLAIPIHNIEGELVAYAGRWPAEPQAGNDKYKWPNGFRKHLELFNAHRAIASEQEAPLVVVEGFFDAMAIHQAGYERVVALMDSSLSGKQEELLIRLSETEERLILFFNSDEAGQKGQADALARLSTWLYVQVATLLEEEATQPNQLTPDELGLYLPFPEGRHP